ncbi:MAG: sigma-54-dependent transcriptional regulator [Nitrospirota bacterium]
MARVISVLIVDDELNVREVLRTELAADGFSAVEAGSGAAALAVLQEQDVDVMLLDLTMPGMTGFEVLKQVRTLDFPPEVIILTANAAVSTAVEAMKLGAYDYVLKPADLEDLTVLIEKAYEKKQLRSENLLLRSQLQRQSDSLAIIGRSRAMLNCLETARRAAETELSVLITGESGVGKELVARYVHRGSSRRAGSFVALNCGAIPEGMIESELFGHEKGAFTGAHDRKPGMLELADGGTLFLDEIGDMPVALQVKLLRVLETRRFFRLGGTKELQVDIRIVSATNKDLAGEIQRGTFRGDLYYRLAGLTIGIPPLRDRREDIPLLLEHFRGEMALRVPRRFGPDAVQVLTAYGWPGNVRELRNVVQRTLVLAQNLEVTAADLPADIAGVRATAGDRLEDVEREHIVKVLARMHGHREKAADALGIHPRTLRRKLQEYGVTE